MNYLKAMWKLWLWIVVPLVILAILSGPAWAQVAVVAEGSCPMARDGKLAKDKESAAYFTYCVAMFAPEEKQMLYFGIYNNARQLESVIQLNVDTKVQMIIWVRGERNVQLIRTLG